MANFCLANRQRLLANIGWDSLMIPRSISLRRRALWTWSRSAFCHVPLSPGRIKSRQIKPPFFYRNIHPPFYREECLPGRSTLFPYLLGNGLQFADPGSMLLCSWTGVLACHFSFWSQGAIESLRGSPSTAQWGRMETCAVGFWLTELGLPLACAQ